MEVHNLPQDIFTDNKMSSERIIIHDYSTKMNFYKGKSILHKNAISLVVSGEKTMLFAEKKVVIKNDEFHFLSAGNCLASIDLSKQDVFRSILLFFDDSVLTDFHVKYDKLVNTYKTKEKITAEPYLLFKKDEFIYNYISSLILILKNENKISMQMRLLKFEELMLYLLEKYPHKILSFQNARKNNFDDLELRKIVEANVTNNLTLEELAFLCKVSVSTFKRQFTKVYGTSPNRWLLQRRMEIAANLLQNHNEKPSEVFYKVGYETHSSFTQSFKHAFGLTPKEYQVQKLNS